MRVITGYLGAGQTTMARSMDGALPPGYDRVWLKKEYGACLLCTRELAGEVQVVALWRRPSQLGVAPAYGAPAGGVTRGAGSHTPSDAESWHVLPAAGREGWLCPSVGSQPAPRSRARRRAARAARRRARVGPWIPPPPTQLGQAARGCKADRYQGPESGLAARRRAHACRSATRGCTPALRTAALCLRVGASQLGWPGGAKRTGPRATRQTDNTQTDHAALQAGNPRTQANPLSLSLSWRATRAPPRWPSRGVASPTARRRALAPHSGCRLPLGPGNLSA